MNSPYNLKRPKKVDDYVLQIADFNYLYFSKKERYGYCTACGKKVDLRQRDKFDRITELQHNNKTMCPHCGKEVFAKEKRYGRLNLQESGRLLWFVKKGKATFAELDEYDIDYTGTVPVVSYWPSAQYKFSKKETKYFKHHPETNYWEERKNIMLPSATHGAIGYWQSARYQKTNVYRPTIKNLGTDLKYQTMTHNTVHRLENYIDEPYLIIKYFENFLKYPSIEILEKSGFDKLVYDKIRGNGCMYIQWSKSNLKDILRMPPKKIKELREEVKYMSDYTNSFELINSYKRMKKQFPEEEISFDIANDFKLYTETTFSVIESVTTLEKAIKYISSQKGMTLGDYRDYIEDCKRLSRDLNKKQILKPADLKTAHEETSKLVKIQVDKDKMESFIRNEEKLAGELNGFESDGLILKTATGPADLRREGDELHHCVATYIDKVCKGKTSILFIREKANPDIPYYTMELSSEGKIVQVRGYRNKDMTEDVRVFVEEIEIVINNKKKNKKRRAA